MTSENVFREESERHLGIKEKDGRGRGGTKTGAVERSHEKEREAKEQLGVDE